MIDTGQACHAGNIFDAVAQRGEDGWLRGRWA